MTKMPDYHSESFDQFGELTKLIIRDRTIHPSLRNRFAATTTWQLSIMIGIILSL